MFCCWFEKEQFKVIGYLYVQYIFHLLDSSEIIQLYVHLIFVILMFNVVTINGVMIKCRRTMAKVYNSITCVVQ